MATLDQEEMSYSKSEQGDDISKVALKAAIELDNIILGKDTSRDYLNNLASKFKQFEAPASTHCQSTFFNDSSFVIMISKAMAHSQWKTNLNTITQLREEASKLSHTLYSIPNDDKESLKRIRAFCVSLSMAFSDYQGRPNNVPVHPCRKLA